MALVECNKTADELVALALQANFESSTDELGNPCQACTDKCNTRRLAVRNDTIAGAVRFRGHEPKLHENVK